MPRIVIWTNFFGDSEIWQTHHIFWIKATFKNIKKKSLFFVLSEIFNFFYCRAATENSQELLMPQRLSVAIKFPFCPSNIQMEELDIPEFYNGLNSILKKM